jgi:hypothetical protein
VAGSIAVLVACVQAKDHVEIGVVRHPMLKKTYTPYRDWCHILPSRHSGPEGCPMPKTGELRMFSAYPGFLHCMSSKV